MRKEPVFGTYDLDTYKRWRPVKVFTRYLNMLIQEELHPEDANELKRVEEFLMSMPFPDKVKLYNQIGGKKERNIYRHFIIPKFEL